MCTAACAVAAPAEPGVSSTKEVAKTAHVVRSNRGRHSARRRDVLRYPSSARTAGSFGRIPPLTLGEGDVGGNCTPQRLKNSGFLARMGGQTKEPRGVGRRGLTNARDVLTAQFGDELADLGDEGRFIGLTAIGHRRQKGAVGLDVQTL